MGRWLIAGALLVAAVVGLAAFAQSGATRATGSEGATAVTALQQGLVHEGHLIVLRGSMLNVYDVRNLPDAKLVYAAQVPGSLEEAHAIMTAYEATAASQPADGKTVYASLDCSKCHRISGKGRTVGPDLTHEGSKHNEAWIEQKITDPKATKKDSIMPAHKLPKQQPEALGQYLAGLK